MDNHQQEIVERLARIETHLSALVGNGQPGRIKLLEDKVESLIAVHNQRVGIRYAISFLAGTLGGLLGLFVGHR